MGGGEIPLPFQMLEREYWEVRQHWIDFAKEKAEFGMNRLTKLKGPRAFPEFDEVAWKAFEEKGFPIKRITSWINTQRPKEGDGYDGPDYPHEHQNNKALSLIHYLVPGDVPAPLWVLEDDKETLVEEIFPEPGLTVYMPDSIWHGARKNNGTTNRIALIAMAHR